MATGFEQQDPSVKFVFLKSAATPQHGQKADREAAKLRERRSFQPRPAH